MKNVCIVLQRNVNVPIENGAFDVIKTFSEYGCAFMELRVVPLNDAEKMHLTLHALKMEYETVVLLTERRALQEVAGRVLETFGQGSFLGGVDGAGTYADGQTTLYLLTSDEAETGVAYAKSVCLPNFQKRYAVRFDKTVLRAMGANIVHVEQLLRKAQALDGGKMQYLHTRKYDEDVLEIHYDESVPKMLLDDVVRLFADGLGDTLYALSDSSLEEQLIELLKLRRKKISLAESFTGGGIARRLVSVSGASEVYFEGLNTYNEDSKIRRLGVSEYTLKTFGAVSDQTAYEMALGLLNTGCCDLAIATTGLAGPKTDRSMLPVGLCFIAVGTKEQISVYRYKFDGERTEITEKAINYALLLAYKQLKKM